METLAKDTKNPFGYVRELLESGNKLAEQEIALHAQDADAPGGRMWWQRMETLLEYGKRGDVIEHFKIVDRRIQDELAGVGTVSAEEYTS